MNADPSNDLEFTTSLKVKVKIPDSISMVKFKSNGLDVSGVNPVAFVGPVLLIPLSAASNTPSFSIVMNELPISVANESSSLIVAISSSCRLSMTDFDKSLESIDTVPGWSVMFVLTSFESDDTIILEKSTSDNLTGSLKRNSMIPLSISISNSTNSGSVWSSMTLLASFPELEVISISSFSAISLKEPCSIERYVLLILVAKYLNLSSFKSDVVSWIVTI